MTPSMDVKSGDKLLSLNKIDDLKTWLSTALTNQDTCLDALEELNSTFLVDVKSKMQNSIEYASNSLVIVSCRLAVEICLHVPSAVFQSCSFPGDSRRRLEAREREREWLPEMVIGKEGEDSGRLWDPTVE